MTQSAKPKSNPTPVIETSKTGRRYVRAIDIIRSDRGQLEIKRIATHQNRTSKTNVSVKEPGSNPSNKQSE
jgi:hypothetical protein